MDEMQGLPPLDLNVTGPFYVQQHPLTDDTCVYDANNEIVDMFFYPSEAQKFCDELNAEHESLLQANPHLRK